jgi:hypothetical protein
VTAFSYGKLAPHPEETHPRVRLSSHLAVTPAVPAKVDYATLVSSWPSYGNYQIGDCTCAALGHWFQAITLYGKGEEVTLPYSDILSLYEAVSGYNPATGANDHGAVEQDVLAYVAKHGLGGHKIRAFAQVDHTNLEEMKQALDIFGAVYVGFQVPQSAEQQFGAGEPWTIVPGSPFVGGHAIDIQAWDSQYIYAVTWGKLQAMSVDFWKFYGDEAWVILTDDWVNSKTGLSPTGLDLGGLLTEFDSLYEETPVKAKKTCPFLAWVKRILS